ncbi:hypothetical protein ACQKP6_04135 [Pseudomonas fluorescens]|uniref:hypothetical protein n=1 Tax=Pseudomonas fluorescens TaxID=294 RepID=UPI003CFEE25A
MKQDSLRQRLPVSDFDVRVLKVVSVAPVNFVTCPEWAVFVVNQQLDALQAQEKTRFEEIHRST